jgi:hypothetical protein
MRTRRLTSCAKPSKTSASRNLRGLREGMHQAAGSSLWTAETSRSRSRPSKSRCARASRSALQNLGASYAAVGRYREAAEALERCAREFSRGDRDRRALLDEAARVRARMAVLVLRAAQPALRVDVDGRPVSAADAAAGLSLDPGEHRVSAHFDRGTSREMTVSLRTSERTEVDLEPSIEPTTRPAQLPSPAPPPESRSPTQPVATRPALPSRPADGSPPARVRGSDAGVTIAAASLGGVSLASTAIAIGLGVTTLREWSELSSRCGSTPCALSDVAQLDRGRSMQTATNVTIAMAAVTAGAAAAVAVVGWRGSRGRAAEHASLTFRVGLSVIAVHGAF